MKILLINNNPVVSRLTALSARKEEIDLGEIQEVTELSSENYDIVFVDADSLTKDVLDVISENITTHKTVLFYAQDDIEDREDFDISILKPFLPSEVSSVIRRVEKDKEQEKASLVVKKSEPQEEVKIESEKNLDLFTDTQESKKEVLFDLNDDLLDIPKVEDVPKVEKVAVQDDFMEDFEEIDLFAKNNNIDKKVEEIPLVKEHKEELEDDLFEEPIKYTDVFFELNLNKEKLPQEEKLSVKESTTKEVELVEDKALDFDFEKNNELDFADEKLDLPIEEVVEVVSIKEPENTTIDTQSVKSTKVLDALEIDNIKDILEDDKDDVLENNDELMELSDTTSPKTHTMSSALAESLKEAEKKEEKSASELNTNISLAALAHLPLENLKKLLAGSHVNISIKFPKD